MNKILLKKYLFIFVFFPIIICKYNYFKKYNNSLINGFYYIKSLMNNYYFLINNKKIMLSINKSILKIIEIEKNIYIIFTNYNKRLGVNKKNKIKLFNSKKYVNNTKTYWILHKIDKNEYLIQNKYNQNYLMVNKVSNNLLLNVLDNNKKIENNYIFIILKIFKKKKLNKQYSKIIENEPIDILIKYIDLNDRTLKRKGIKQIYKDYDNEELRYSVRSILQYIPWVRKIFILMPNKKVRFFRSINKIKEKIVYIKDKDFLGYDSANIHSFTFNLYKMEKFGISKNFIYMEDDFFIGKPLKKSDFFYYDIKEKKIFPYLLTSRFNKLNKTLILNQYYNMFKNKDSINPHSSKGWKFSVLSTNKYFLEKYNISVINARFTHNAIAENIDDLKEIFNEIKSFEYINETLFSKERHILTLNQPQFFNLYQLNIKHRKIHSIPYKYVRMENINKAKLNKPLFVINTGGHKPSIKQYKIQKNIMEIRYPFPTKYEKINYKSITNDTLLLCFNIMIILIKLYIIKMK